MTGKRDEMSMYLRSALEVEWVRERIDCVLRSARANQYQAASVGPSLLVQMPYLASPVFVQSHEEPSGSSVIL